jgi:hypothetical protein
MRRACRPSDDETKALAVRHLCCAETLSAVRPPADRRPARSDRAG